jgi:uncharacterized coiled-coil DUF342 family protein
MENGSHEKGPSQCQDIKTVKELTLPEITRQLDTLKEKVAEIPGIIRRVDRHDDTIDECKENISKLFTAQGETKVLVNQILDKLDGLENKIFSYMTQAVASATQAVESSIKDKEKTGGINKDLIDLVKYVLALTIGVIVSAIFLKGWKVIP